MYELHLPIIPLKLIQLDQCNIVACGNQIDSILSSAVLLVVHLLHNILAHNHISSKVCASQFSTVS